MHITGFLQAQNSVARRQGHFKHARHFVDEVQRLQNPSLPSSPVQPISNDGQESGDELFVPDE